MNPRRFFACRTSSARLWLAVIVCICFACSTGCERTREGPGDQINAAAHVEANTSTASEERLATAAEKPDLFDRPYVFDFAHVGPVNKEAAFEGLCKNPMIGFQVAVEMLEDLQGEPAEREAKVERLARLAAAERDCHISEVDAQRANKKAFEVHRQAESMGNLDGVQVRDDTAIPRPAGLSSAVPVAGNERVAELLSLYLTSVYHSIAREKPSCDALLYRHAARAFLSDSAGLEADARRSVEEALRTLRETYHRGKAVAECDLYTPDSLPASEAIIAAAPMEDCEPPIEQPTRADMQQLFDSFGGRWRGEVIVCGQRYTCGGCCRRITCVTKQKAQRLGVFEETEIEVRPELLEACKPGSPAAECMPVFMQHGRWYRPPDPVLSWIGQEMRSLEQARGRHKYLTDW